MKFFSLKDLILFFVLVFLILLPFRINAQNLVVDFEADPLFSEANFLPGNEVVRTVDVTNNTEVSKNVLTEAINAHDNDGLGDELSLVIKEGENILYEDTLGDFLREGIVSLSSLGAGESTTYSFSVTFDINAGNETQNGTLGFDLCVGFEGGEMNCGDTIVGGENNGGEEGGGVGGDPGGGVISGGSSGGGSSGGGGGIVNTTSLVVFNEQVVGANSQNSTATITWESNLLSTSQVIYGPASGGPYSLNLTSLPYFGYPSGTVEDPLKVTSHSVVLTGLVSGEVYKFRVVSRASPPTVGYEYEFTFNNNVVVSKPTSTGGVGGSSQGGGSGSSGGASTGSSSGVGSNSSSGGSVPSNQISTGVEEEDLNVSNNTSSEKDNGSFEDGNENQNLALAFFGVPGTMGEWLECLGVSLIVLVVIFFAWLLWKNKHKNNPLYLEQSKKKGSLFFFMAIIVAGLIMFFLHRCTLLPLLVAALISVFIYLREVFA